MCFCTRTFRVCTAAALAWATGAFPKDAKNIRTLGLRCFGEVLPQQNNSGGTEQPTKDFELHMDNSGVGVLRTWRSRNSLKD